jgi:hypothetical protein
MSEWIKVEDRLPESSGGLPRSQCVLAYCPGNRCTFTAYYDYEDSRWEYFAVGSVVLLIPYHTGDPYQNPQETMMSEITQRMAEEMYERMCEYVGPNHGPRCIEYIKITLDSMETEMHSARNAAMKEAARICRIEKRIARQIYNTQWNEACERCAVEIEQSVDKT